MVGSLPATNTNVESLIVGGVLHYYSAFTSVPDPLSTNCFQPVQAESYNAYSDLCFFNPVMSNLSCAMAILKTSEPRAVSIPSDNNERYTLKQNFIIKLLSDPRTAIKYWYVSGGPWILKDGGTIVGRFLFCVPILTHDASLTS